MQSRSMYVHDLISHFHSMHAWQVRNNGRISQEERYIRCISFDGEDRRRSRL